MPANPAPDPGAILLADECFATQDARFLDCLSGIDSHKWLAAFAERWLKDARPWARQQIFDYLDRPLAHPGHQPLVKRLFKGAEARRDLELLGAFLVAFDVLIRRERRTRSIWDNASRSVLQEEYLRTPRNALPTEHRRRFTDPRGRVHVVDVPVPRQARLFHAATRLYLRRRAWRFFRWLGYREPAAYPAAVAHALRRYRDVDFAAGENILDSWALLHIAFHGCDALEFRESHHRLREGRRLSELIAAPRFPEAWETPSGARVLLGLLDTARSRLVRTWTLDLLRRPAIRALLDLQPDDLFALLQHEDDLVQQFAADLLREHPALAKLTVETWLRLLTTRNAGALATICEAFERHVSGERLTLAQVIELATSAPVPVARLGFRLLQARAISSAELPALADLSAARAPALAGELTTWTLGRLLRPEDYQLEFVCRFFDSLQPNARLAAWAWLQSPGGVAGYRDAVLWSRLTETPFEDLRLRLIDDLARRAEAPAPAADALAPVWCAVLLAVHRGGRQKLKATRQIAEAILREPTRAESLLPVLAVAIRSIRGPEMRAGLGAVMTLLAARPQLTAAVRRHLPELEFPSQEVAA